MLIPRRIRAAFTRTKPNPAAEACPCVDLQNARLIALALAGAFDHVEAGRGDSLRQEADELGRILRHHATGAISSDQLREYVATARVAHEAAEATP